MQIDNDMQTHSMFSKLFVHSKSYILSCSNILNGSIEKLFFSASIIIMFPNLTTCVKFKNVYLRNSQEVVGSPI